MRLPAGEVDREALGKLVFSDAAARRKLNAATHLPIALSLIWQLLVLSFSTKPMVVRVNHVGGMGRGLPTGLTTRLGRVLLAVSLSACSAGSPRARQ